MTPMQIDAVLGIDLGTSGCKATVFSLEGRELGAGYAGYEFLRPGPALVEQDPRVWWEAAVAATRAAIALADGAVVRAVGLGSANALLLLDAAGKPVRPAIMQLDRRAVDEAQQVEAAVGTAQLLDVTGTNAKPGVHWLPTLLWLREHEPQSWRRASSVVFPSGWLMSLLTGVVAVDTSRAATTLVMDQRSRTWSQAILGAVGLDSDLLPPLVEATASSHFLTHQAASALGLPPNIPVTVGVMDSAAATLAASKDDSGLVVILGTTARVTAMRETYRSAVDLVTCPAPGSTNYLGMAVVWNAGHELHRAASVWGGEPDFARLDDSLGSGSGSDLRAGQARELTQSILRNIADAADHVRAWAENSHSEVAVTGRASRNQRLVELLGVELGVPVTTSPWPDAETRGAALVAAVAAGFHADLAAARRAFAVTPTQRSTTAHHIPLARARNRTVPCTNKRR
jgi:xylulokinase